MPKTGTKDKKNDDTIIGKRRRNHREQKGRKGSKSFFRSFPSRSLVPCFACLMTYVIFAESCKILARSSNNKKKGRRRSPSSGRVQKKRADREGGKGMKKKQEE
jgi:hypothetical protein